ncbi:MarR family winged helix-turn-helix transcriptional regulator [Cohnella laeviribosi]|jgi:DNA-binding MarR family transcriptional regulator|uniref:MarR family winged helix-turn-helix transcriptional regulator n=1 Tax=Cohnella laeviribosi TaxID=380174 RepID=UPI00035F080E|nr:MarR family transcriptional regulator [Cohnella laeviribosi]
MKQDELLKLDNQLCFAVYACTREITKLYTPLLKELGLTYTQYVTLLALWEKDRVSVKELGQRLYLDSGTLTPLLKKLESQGLVARTRDSRDERNVLISLTDEGRKLKEKACGIPMAIVRQLGLSAEEAEKLRDDLADLLNKIQLRHQPT